MVARLAPLLVSSVALALFPLAARSADPEAEGLCAYGAGRFGVAAVSLDQSIHDPRRRSDASSPISVYLLGRTFQELGVRGLALRHLARTERDGGPEWRLLARRWRASISRPAIRPRYSR